MSDAVSVEVDPAEVGFEQSRLERIGTHFDRYVEQRKIPGWSALVTRHGSIAWTGRGGHRDIEAGLPVELDTIFRIYSMSKPITSVAVMMLWEQGAFELTDPVSRFIPSFADSRVFVGGSDLKPATEPLVEPVRIWHLLTHTSGLTYGFHHAHPVDTIYRSHGYEWRLGPPGRGLAETVDVFAGMPLLFQPGSEWNYGVSTDVLGRLVEVVSGKPLDVALREMIFEPLGMTDTWFAVPPEEQDRLAALYAVSSKGPARSDVLGQAAIAPEYFSGGGGLSSTLHDYHRFTQLLRGRGELDGVRLLGDRTVRYMTRNHLPGGRDLKQFGRPLFAESPFDGVGFGLGFSVTLDPAATHTLGSSGEFAWGGAASTAFFVDPVEDLTVVFMTQLMPSSAYPIRSQLRQLVYSALVA